MRRIGICLKRCWHKYHLNKVCQTALFIAILTFVVITFERNWTEVSAINLTYQGWACLTLATGVTLLAYIWTGQVWGWILKALGYPVDAGWAIRTFLLTDLAKYLPSNLFHLVGRTRAAMKVGVSTGAASLSVILDSMLLIASGWILGLLSVPTQGLLAGGLGLGTILIVIHPKSLRFFLNKTKLPFKPKTTENETAIPSIHKYPLDLLLGKLGYVFMRGVGFVLTLYALTTLPLPQVPQIISIYSIAWLLGYITPGAPGGIGIYEATSIELLQLTTDLQAAQILAAVAISRLVATLAEMIGAATAWLDEQLLQRALNKLGSPQS